MGIFAQFFTWLNASLLAFVFSQIGAVAAALTPAVVTLATIYVMFWGYLQLTGKIQEPILEGAKRIFVIAGILIFTIQLAANVGPITSVFFNSPQALAATITGSPQPVAAVDALWRDGNRVAEQLFAQGTIWSGSGWGLFIAGGLVYLLVGLTCVYTAFLMAMSLVAIAVILALGPLFIAMLFFDATKRFFEAWIAQLANYGLIIILVALVASLLLTFFQVAATAAVAMGAGITVAEAARLCVVSVLIFLVISQVPSIAAGLASGIALSTFGAVGRTLSWGMGGTGRTGYQTMRGLFDNQTTRWDSLRRKAGYAIGQGARNTGRAMWRGMQRSNTIARRS